MIILKSDLLEQAIELAKRREVLCSNNPQCPKCETHQVQIIDVEEQKWRCRHCKTEIITEYA